MVRTIRHAEGATEVRNGMAMEGCRAGAQDIPGDLLSIKTD